MKILRKLSWRDLCLLFCAISHLVVIRVSLWVLPFSVVQRYFGQTSHALSIASNSAGGVAVERLVWAVTVAGRYIPKATCLVEAYTLNQMMIIHGYSPSLQIGVSKAKAKEFAAHAWIEYQGAVLIGDLSDLKSYTPLPSINQKN